MFQVARRSVWITRVPESFAPSLIMSRCRIPSRSDRMPVRGSFTQRKGATVVEFAVVAPIVFLMFFSAIMFFGMITTQNTLTSAAREGGRLAALRSVTSQDVVIDKVKDFLQGTGVNPEWVTVNVDPADMSSLDAGDEVSISVSLPMNKSTWLQYAEFQSGTNLTAEITYLRE